MQDDILEQVVFELLSIPPLTFRATRKKLVKSMLHDMDVDITPLHLEIIRTLEEEGTLHAAEIGEKLQIAKAQMTKLIDKLVEMDMVEKTANSIDRRTVNISLTDHGRSIIEEQKQQIVDCFREALSVLSEQDLRDLSASLRKQKEIFLKIQ